MGSSLGVPRIPRDFDGSVNGRVADSADLASERLWERCELIGVSPLFCDFLIETHHCHIVETGSESYRLQYSSLAVQAKIKSRERKRKDDDVIEEDEPF